MKKMNLNLTQEQKEQLKHLVEEDGFNLLDDIENAKNSLKDLTKSAKEIFGIESAMFKKLVKINFENSLEEERLKFNAIDTLYFQIFGDTDLLKEGE